MRQLIVSVNHPLAIGPTTRPMVRKPMEKFRNGTAPMRLLISVHQEHKRPRKKGSSSKSRNRTEDEKHHQIDAARFTKRSHRKDEARAIKQTAVSKVAREPMRQRHADSIGGGIGSDEPGCLIEGRTDCCR